MNVTETADTLTGRTCDTVVLRVGNRRWQVPADAVVEVVPWPRLSPVPLSRCALLGIFGFAGVVVPVASVAAGDGVDMREGRHFAVAVVVRVRCGGRPVLLALAADEAGADSGAPAEPLDLALVVAALRGRQNQEPGGGVGDAPQKTFSFRDLTTPSET
jgi:CheW-like protein